MRIQFLLVLSIVVIFSAGNVQAQLTGGVTGEQAMTSATHLYTTAKAAIAASAAKATVKEKVDFLVGEAKGFMNVKNYGEAMTVAAYVQSKLDSHSPQAKSIFNQAKHQIDQRIKGTMGKMLAGVKI